MNQSDIGECLIGIHNCSQLCMELNGGYECGCSNGYELEEDRVTCEGSITWPLLIFLLQRHRVVTLYA